MNPISKTALKFLMYLLVHSNVLSQQDSIIPEKAIGNLLDIGGWKLHYNYVKATNQNSPTIIFESGIRGFSFEWIPIQQKLTSIANSFAYDRSGYAWSQLGPKPHTLKQTVYNLHTLLRKAGLKPPYILVGASHGGMVARLFTQTYPEEVMGLVLVDAAYEDGVQYINGKKTYASLNAGGKKIPEVKTQADDTDNNLARTQEAITAIGGALKSMGFPFKSVEHPFNMLPDSIQKLRLWALNQFEFYVANENEYILDEKVEIIRERKKTPFMFSDKPLIVLTATSSGNPNDPDEIDRLKNQSEMTNLSKNSKQIVINDSGHHIHVEKPDIIIEAIKMIIGGLKQER
ncbi:alpha/beta hydrolase [Flavitalea sp.]|nr:alpha/beta hydrolase [Flavitalea sp.]